MIRKCWSQFHDVWNSGRQSIPKHLLSRVMFLKDWMCRNQIWRSHQPQVFSSWVAACHTGAISGSLISQNRNRICHNEDVIFHHEGFFSKQTSKIIQTHNLFRCALYQMKKYFKMEEYFGSDLDVKFCAINNLHLRGSQENIESPNSARILSLEYYRQL